MLWHPVAGSRRDGPASSPTRSVPSRRAQLSSARVLFPDAEGEALGRGRAHALRAGVQYHWSITASRRSGTSSRPAAEANAIRRKRKQPAIDGTDDQTLSADDLAAGGSALSEDAYLYLTTVDKHFYGRRYLNRKFFELVRQRFAHRLAWVVARNADNGIVASAFNIKKKDILYGRYWGRPSSAILHFSVCYYHGIDGAIRGGSPRSAGRRR